MNKSILIFPATKIKNITHKRLRLAEAELAALDPESLPAEETPPTGARVSDTQESQEAAGSSGVHTPGTSQNLTQSEVIATMSKAFADAMSMNNSSSNQAHLINRLAADKQTLQFSRNSLEWLRFKKAFNLSSELGKFSDSENVVKLYNCLKG